MQTTYKGTNYDVTGQMQAFAEKKLNALRKFTNDADHIYVELGRETEAHHNGRIWRAEFNLDKEGVRFRSTATEETLENAIDTAIGDLARELRSAKSKRQGFIKRGGAAVKNMLRGFRG